MQKSQVRILYYTNQKSIIDFKSDKKHAAIFYRRKEITHMEYLMASIAEAAGKKSSTSTFLFSFFLSIIHHK